jgi:predicted transcriptional regulator
LDRRSGGLKEMNFNKVSPMKDFHVENPSDDAFTYTLLDGMPDQLRPNEKQKTNGSLTGKCSGVKPLSRAEILEKGAKINDLRLTINLPENHFITKYTKWLSGLTDAYKDYNIMCSLWLLSAACHGKVQLRLKQGTIYPNIWIILFGLSTISRKTTVINKTKTVFEACTQEKLYNDDYSLEGYLELLQDNPVCNIVRDEVVGLFQKYEKKYNDGIHELECSIYDGGSYRKSLSSGRNGKKKEVVVNSPYVTHLYATTPGNFGMCLSLENFYSGFGFRFLYCYPKYERPRMQLAVATEDDNKAFADILQDYISLWTKFKNYREKVDFKIDPKAIDYLEGVRAKVEGIIAEKNDNNLSSAWGRNCDHILKLCMLIEIGKNDISFTISLETMKEACRITSDYFLPLCIETIERLQDDVRNNKVEKVRGLLARNNGTCNHSKLLRNSNMVSREFNEVIQTMIESGEVELCSEKESNSKWYVLIRDSSLSSSDSFTSLVRTESNEPTNVTKSRGEELIEDNKVMTCPYYLDSSNELINYTNSTNDTKSSHLKIPELMQFCADWERLLKTSIDKSNVNPVAVEYCQKRKYDDLAGVENVIRRYAKII